MTKTDKIRSQAHFAKKATSIACATALVLGLVPTIAFATSDTLNGESSTDGLVANDKSSQVVETSAESFRYHDGQLIDDTASLLSTYSTLAATAWSGVNGVFYNDLGAEISGAYAKGMDVSQWQGAINWDTVKYSSDIDFAIIRCGWGLDETDQDDTYWERNASECERLGIPYGVYIYSHAANTSEALSEASHVIRLLAGHSPSYPVYMDIEDDDIDLDNVTAIVNTFCTAIQNAGYIPGIYSSLYWWQDYLSDPSLNQWDHWIAQWNHTCDYTGTYSLWQCTSSGTVPGISGSVDLNFAMSDYSSCVENGVYRLYNPITSEHLFTTDRSEYLTLARSWGWRQERTAWIEPSSGTPVYRLYNAGLGNHLYTSDQSEIDMLISDYGWVYDNNAQPMMYSGGDVPVYRLYNESLGGMHLLTTDYSEYISLPAYGWQQEGIAMYAQSL